MGHGICNPKPGLYRQWTQEEQSYKQWTQEEQATGLDLGG